MKRNLIICGPQGSGKSALAAFIGQNPKVRVFEEIKKECILFLRNDILSFIYVTQDKVEYGPEFPKEQFLIITLG